MLDSKIYTVTTAITGAAQRLQAAGCDTPRLDAELLLAHVLGKSRTWLMANPAFRLDEKKSQEFFKLISRRQEREPVAYIVGQKAFFGLDFLVSPAVLTPRPETELLVETTLQLAQHYPAPSIADVGAGSGCIAIALAAHLKTASLFAIDVSALALAVARQNAERHRVAERITFLTGDLLEPLAGPVDIVASNPPYIDHDTLNSAALMPEVRRYEPRLALDGGRQGLDLIRRLLAQAHHKLKPNGCLLIEIGSDQGQAAVTLARDHFPQAEIELKFDLAGLDRLLVVRKNGADNLKQV